MSAFIELSGNSFRLRILALTTLLTLAAAPGSWRPVYPEIAASIPSETSARVPAGSVIGSLVWGRIGCLGCAGLLIGAGAGTVFGVVAVAAAWPEYAFWCAFGCYRAFR